MLVTVTTRRFRPRYRVVAREVDADDVTAADGDAVFLIEGEVTVADPQRHDHCLANQTVPVIRAIRPLEQRKYRPKRRPNDTYPCPL